MSNNVILPLLVIFSVDFNFWPFILDHTRIREYKTPFVKNCSTGVIFDKYGKVVNWYKDVPIVLQKLKDDGVKIGATSRAEDIKGTRQLLQLLDWEKYIDVWEMNNTISKKDQIIKIQENTGIKYSEMIVFEDSILAIKQISELGVCCIEVNRIYAGINMTLLEEGLHEFRQRRLKDIHA